MKLQRAVILCFSMLAYENPLFAMNPVKPELSGCETFLDQKESKEARPSGPIEHVRNFINLTTLKNYKPVPSIRQTAAGVVAYGKWNSAFLQNLPNFTICQFDQHCSYEFNELNARGVASMVEKFRPNWANESIWFFEVTEPISLLKHQANIPMRFESGTWLIMKETFPIGRAFLDEIYRIEWF